MENKPLWLSKTAILNALVMLAGALSALGIVPAVKLFLESNSELVLMVLGGAGIGLRMITKGKVDLW
jgi:hypothetical protein